MRPTREQAKENRQRILDTASRLFRENGIHAVGVDAVMKGAGLTHGGFYGHFKSKGDLTAEAVSHALDAGLQSFAGVKSMEEFADGYLSNTHRDEAGNGCAVAALGPELARLPEGQRGTVSEYVQAQIAQIERLETATDGMTDRRKAIVHLTSLIGALIISRAVDDHRLSEEILTETRRSLADARAEPANS